MRWSLLEWSITDVIDTRQESEAQNMFRTEADMFPAEGVHDGCDSIFVLSRRSGMITGRSTTSLVNAAIRDE